MELRWMGLEWLCKTSLWMQAKKYKWLGSIYKIHGGPNTKYTQDQSKRLQRVLLSQSHLEKHLKLLLVINLRNSLWSFDWWARCCSHRWWCHFRLTFRNCKRAMFQTPLGFNEDLVLLGVLDWDSLSIISHLGQGPQLLPTCALFGLVLREAATQSWPDVVIASIMIFILILIFFRCCQERWAPSLKARVLKPDFFWNQVVRNPIRNKTWKQSIASCIIRSWRSTCQVKDQQSDKVVLGYDMLCNALMLVTACVWEKRHK